MIYKTVPMKHQENATTLGIRTIQSANYLALFGEIGTGKTKIALDIFVNSRHFINHMVIMCPKGLFGTWTKEIAKHTDLKNHQVIRWDEIKKVKGERIATENMLARSGYIFIINIEALQYQNEKVEKLLYDLSKKQAILCLDESVKIQTPGANRTKAAIKVSQWFTQRIIMTGTDISSGPQAIYSQFLFLDKNFWKTNLIQNFTSFKASFCLEKKVRIHSGREIAVVKRLDEMSNIERSIQKAKLEKLNKIIEPFTIRILRKDCLDLPPQINICVPIQLSKEERNAYDSMKKTCIAEIDGEFNEAVNAISAFSKLRQITSGHIGEQNITDSPAKLQYLLDDIEDHSEHAIIVAYFQHDVELITRSIAKQEGSDSVASYFGLNSDKVNAEAKDRFEQGKLRFLVASHSMIAQGHNLQEHCHLMYVYSVDLNSEVNAQYKGRIDRTGQHTNPVYKHLLAENTIDESIHELIEQKMNLQSMFSNMGKKDLMKMLGEV